MSRKSCLRIVFYVLVPVHTFLLAWLMFRYSPTTDEVAHLSAGVRILKEGKFDLYHVNPPLVKTVAAIPAVAVGAKVDWQNVSLNPSDRFEWDVGRDFIRANQTGAFWFFTFGRLLCIPFSLLGLIVCFYWADNVFGPVSGVFSASLWCFSPNILANGALITPDMATTSLGFLVLFCFRKWLLRPTWNFAFIVGLLLGIAQLAKMSWVLMYAILPLIWLIHEGFVKWKFGSPDSEKTVVTRFCQVIVILMVSIEVLNLGYVFEGTFEKLGSYRFTSNMFGQPDLGNEGNRFRGTLLEVIPVPLPKPYLTGIDLQRRDFEGGWRPMYSYLGGQQRIGGWWYYYIYCMFVKVPIGWLVVGFVSIFVIPWKTLLGSRNSIPDLLCLVLPPLFLFCFVSSQIGFTRYFRYVLPCFPFVAVLASGVVSPIVLPARKWIRVISFIGLIWGAASSLWVFPHSLAYFNTIAGGPENGHWHLLDGNVDWGQDMFFLKEYLVKNEIDSPIFFSCSTQIDPASLGIETMAIPASADQRMPELSPGWYVVSVNMMHDYDQKDSRLSYFLKFSSVDSVGYSMRVFRIED